MKWAVGCLFLISIVSSALAQDVRSEVDRAFKELNGEVANLDSSRQAKLKLLVEKELASLGLGLEVVGMDSVRVARILAIVRKHVDSLMAGISDPVAKIMAFNGFMDEVRQRLGLTPARTSGQTKIPDSGTVTTTLTVPGPPVPMADIASARQQANWSKNLEDVPKNWYERVGQVWTSDDGLITFAVGRGQSRVVELARNKAQVDAGNVLARRSQESGVATAPAGGVSTVRYTPSSKDGVVYCLVAIPTALLPK